MPGGVVRPQRNVIGIVPPEMQVWVERRVSALPPLLQEAGRAFAAHEFRAAPIDMDGFARLPSGVLCAQDLAGRPSGS
jgi:hypothetical protein